MGSDKDTIFRDKSSASSNRPSPESMVCRWVNSDKTTVRSLGLVERMYASIGK